MNEVIILFKSLIVLSLTFAIYYLLDYIKSNRAIENLAHRIYSNADKRYLERKEEKERFYLEEGNREKESVFYNLDLMIERSGLRKKVKFLTTEIYIGFVAIITVVVTLISGAIGGVLIALLGCMISIVGVYGAIYILSGINYEKIDKEIVAFVNLVENYSISDNDIVRIMGNVSQYLKDPLKTYIEDFYTEASNTGEVSIAFLKLENRIENGRLKSIIRNLEICSRNEANYNVIIEDERRSLKGYIKSKEKKKAIIRSGRSDIIATLGMSGVLIFMFLSFAPSLLINLITTLPGNVILIYCIIVMGICAWNFISFDKGEKV